MSPNNASSSAALATNASSSSIVTSFNAAATQRVSGELRGIEGVRD
jgi:hypothetical protein